MESRDRAGSSGRQPPAASRIPPAQRRLISTTDGSVGSRSVSLEFALRESLRLEDRLAAANEDAPDESLNSRLARMLSNRTVVSTTSSFAQRQQDAMETGVQFREIGTGSIGKIFEHPGTTFVYKLPLTSNLGKLWNNYVMHNRAQVAFDGMTVFENSVIVPQSFWFATPETGAFWKHNLHRFPHTLEFPRKERHALCMERIFPLPRPIRFALVEKYCPPQHQEAIKADQGNKDCLMMPMLSRRRAGQGGGRFFSLRNFKLHADQVEDLGLNVNDMVDTMAHALAVLHWRAEIDAKDVEFVIGSSPMEEQTVRSVSVLPDLSQMPPNTSTYEAVTRAAPNFTKRVTSLWLIDFDDCGDIPMSIEGVNRCAKEFMETNPYCPRPSKTDVFIQGLWKQFGERYLHHTEQNVDPARVYLARQFLNRIEVLAKERSEQLSASHARASSMAPGEGQRVASYGRSHSRVVSQASVGSAASMASGASSPRGPTSPVGRGAHGQQRTPGRSEHMSPKEPKRVPSITGKPGDGRVPAGF